MLAVRRPTRRLIPLTAVGALALAAALVPAAATASEPARAGGPVLPAAPGDPVVIDLIGINDFHGRIEQSKPSAGAASLATAVYSFRNANPNTVFVSAGDNIGATTFTSFIQDDQPTIDVLNAMALDVSAFGNHEFDQGRTDVETDVLPAVDFPYLAANIYETATGQPAYDEYFLVDKGGVTVGFIGAMTEALPELVSPAGIAGLEVRDLVTEVNRVAGLLSDGNDANGEADVIVVLMHEGPETGAASEMTGAGSFAPIVAGLDAEVDAVFTGHTHQKFAHLVEQGAVDLPVVGSGQYGENLARVTLTVDPVSGDVTASTAEVIPLYTPDQPGPPVVPGVPVYAQDPVIAQIVTDAVAAAAVPGAVKLGDITASFLRARQADGTENRGGESTLGNLVADVQLWAANDAGTPTDIAFMNPGGLRANLAYGSSGASDPDGNVTYKEAANVQPFANTLVTMTLTGEKVVKVLEEQWQPAGAQRPFLKLGVAGLTYTYDPTAPAGQRITEVWVDGTPIDLAAQYTVVVNSFLASGGDNFATLATGTNKADSGRVDLAAFVDYFAEHTPLTPQLSQRAVGVHLADAPAGGYLPGDTVTVNLSSLLFSAGEVQGTDVTLSIDGTQVATATIDPVAVSTTDEVGRATATFEFPAAATGDVEVDVVVAGTGTTTSFVVPMLGDFDDVSSGDPFYTEIQWMAQAGITTGYSDGTFRGLAPVARDAMAAFLYRVANDGAEAPACTTAPFPDVPVSHPFCGEIAWLAAEGISEGYGDGTFRPSTAVARDAMAAFIYRLVEGDAAAPECTTAPFTDVRTSHPFCAEIQWLKVNDLTNGWPDGTYRPSATIERQAMAAFLFRVVDGGFLMPEPL